MISLSEYKIGGEGGSRRKKKEEKEEKSDRFKGLKIIPHTRGSLGVSSLPSRNQGTSTIRNSFYEILPLP
jgi:hypothetical protein